MRGSYIVSWKTPGLRGMTRDAHFDFGDAMKHARSLVNMGREIVIVKHRDGTVLFDSCAPEGK